MPFEFNLTALALLAIAIIFIAIFIILFYYVYEMANIKGRSVFYWILFSFFTTPLIGIILLKCIGETEEQRRKNIIQEEELKQLIRHNYANMESTSENSRRTHAVSTPESSGFNPSAKTINDIYRR